MLLQEVIWDLIQKVVPFIQDIIIRQNKMSPCVMFLLAQQQVIKLLETGMLGYFSGAAATYKILGFFIWNRGAFITNKWNSNQ